MIGLNAMAAVISTGGMFILIAVFGYQPLDSLLGGLVVYACYAFTLAWATAKESSTEVAEPTTEVEPDAKQSRRNAKIVTQLLSVLEKGDPGSIVPEIKRMLKELDSLRSQDQSKQLKAELEGVRAALKDTESRLKQAESKPAKKAKDVPDAGLVLKCGQLEGALTEAQAAYKSATASRDWALAQAATSKDALDRERVAHERTVGLLYEANILIESLRGEIQSLGNKVQQQHDRHAELVSRMKADFQAELASATLSATSKLTNRVTELEKEIERLSSLSQELERNCIESALRQNQLQAECEQSQQLGRIVQQQADESQQKCVELAERLSTLTNERDSIRTMLQEKGRECLKASRRLELAWKYLEADSDLVTRLSDELDGFGKFVDLLDPDMEMSELEIE